VKKGSRLSPNLEKCCLLLVGNESFANAERDLKMLTGIYVPHSTQHRLLERYKLLPPETTEKVEALSIDGGNVRLRTHEGEERVWRNYKAVKLHGQVAAAFFQNNADLVVWVNSQLQSEVITCLGDGHDGVWNLFNQIGTTEQRREVLDWYHLRENLHKVGGSLKRLRRVESQLWQGSTVEAIAEFVGVRAKESKNFQNYLRKHQSRIPDYQNYQNQGIDIGSGSVESLIKQIGARIKIVGAQWNEKNVPQILRLRCAYLNNEIKMGRYAWLKSGMLPIHPQSRLVFFTLDDVLLLLVHNNCTLCFNNLLFERLQTIILRLYTGVFDSFLKLKYNLFWS